VKQFPFGLLVLLMLLVVFALAAIRAVHEKSIEVTPTPPAAAPTGREENRTRDEWFWRAYIAAKDNRHDAAKVQGEMARIYAMLINPIGDQAGMTKEQRTTAIAAMAEGWAEGAIRR